MGLGLVTTSSSTIVVDVAAHPAERSSRHAEHSASSACRNEKLLFGIRPFTAVIVIIKAHDIVFTQIFATLDLNYHKRNPARIFEAMVLADRNKGRLIDINNLLTVTAGNKGGAGHHDPVFATVMVFLK